MKTPQSLTCNSKIKLLAKSISIVLACSVVPKRYAGSSYCWYYHNRS